MIHPKQSFSLHPNNKHFMHRFSVGRTANDKTTNFTPHSPEVLMDSDGDEERKREGERARERKGEKDIF